MLYIRLKLFQTCKDTKFVSNSQHPKTSNQLVLIVSDVQRYKICQQFTTATKIDIIFESLFQTCKDTKFVSNSQPIDTFILANKIVSDVQRYKICQQFTTNRCTDIVQRKLFQTCKDTKFVSNSQHTTKAV